MTRARRFRGLVLGSCCVGVALLSGGHARAQQAPDGSRAAPTFPALTFPSPSRADLDLPEELWRAVSTRVGAEGRAIGYSAEEMGNYGRSALLLPTVLQLFRDARVVPRNSGRITDGFLADAEKAARFGYGWSEGGLGEIAVRCYALLAVSAGRQTMPDTLDATIPFALDAATERNWQALPQEVRDLVGRLYQAAQDVRPWLLAAYDRELLQEITGQPDLASIRAADLARIAQAHQDDERFDQLATLSPATFRLCETTDLAYLGYATVVWLRYLEYALQVFHAAGGAAVVSGRAIDTFRLATPLGDILIGGTDDDDHRAPAFLTVDLGGNDRYAPGFGASLSLASPVAVLLDLSGDDAYLDPAYRAERDAAAGGEIAQTSAEGSASSGAAVASSSARGTDGDAVVPAFGAGVFGLGALCDLAGDDTYAVRESGLGRGCFGSGLLIDYAGNDSYDGGRWTQGAAHGGIGVLLDLAGDDRYSCAQQSQGLGGTLGTGLLLDLAGQDRYTARDDGNISELYLGQSVAMSQGCGYGRRADLGDGHSLAGGFGLLIDGAGDDEYHAQVWAQGCGYWWGVGILEDRAGNDSYRNGKYSSGAAAHFAIGVHVDLAGDDLYNIDNDTAKNQYQGHARDGSLGIFVDGDGNDSYGLRTHCAGSGDLGAIGVFWDRRGDDQYHYTADQVGTDPWAQTPPLGSTTQYEPFRSFRDELPVYGIFLDTGGADSYETRRPATPAGEGAGTGAPEVAGAANGAVWSMRRNANAWGLGVDAECYPGATRAGAPVRPPR